MAYKICILDNNGKPKQWILYLTYSKEKDILTEEEKQIPHKISKQQIHPDDSIRIIKNKILKDIDFAVGYQEIYLFSQVETRVNRDTIYDTVAKSDSSISSTKFQQLAVNYCVTSEYPAKKLYTRLDFDRLKCSIPFMQNQPIGKNFAKSWDPLFAGNPYDLIPESSVEITLNNQLVSYENQVLLNYIQSATSEIYETTTTSEEEKDTYNTIYVCFAEDVLHYTESIGIKEESVISIYYPFLFEKEILTLDLLKENKQQLIKDTKKAIPKKLYDYYESVDLFYNIYESRKSELPYTKRGIYAFDITLHPEFKYLLPLDAIFRNIHSTKDIPFIKYNPGLRRENIYRLYSESITKFGEKIQFLPKNIVMRLSKEIGKNNQISFYITYEKHDIYIDIELNGNINVYGNLHNPILIDELEKVIKYTLNGLLLYINDFLKKSGYTLQIFDSINDSNVEIKQIQYTAEIQLQDSFSLNKYESCLRPIFEILEPNLDKGAELRYKRIANYKEMNAEEIYISNLALKIQSQKEMVSEIAKYFEISQEEASVKFIKFWNDHDKIQGQFVNKTMSLADSPGFQCNLAIEGIHTIFTANIEINDSPEYVNILHTYIDSLLRITQFPKTSTIKQSEIKSIFERASKVSDIQIQSLPNVLVPVKVATKKIQPYQFEPEEMDIQESRMFFSDEFEDDVIEKPTGFLAREYSSEKDQDGFLSREISIGSNIGSEFGDLQMYQDADLERGVDFDLIEDSPIKDTEFELSPVEKAALSDVDENEDQDKTDEQPDKAKESPIKNLMFDDEFEEDFDGGGPKKKKLDLTETIGSIETIDSLEPNNIVEESDLEPELNLEKRKKQLDGTALKSENTNLFLNKMRKLEPNVFTTTAVGRKFKAYSGNCQWSEYRQPVILTPAEKKRIDAKYPNSYNNAQEYGTDPDKKNWYICPKYWCLLTNSPMTKEQIDAGQCGKKIGRNDDKVKPGHYYYEFNDANMNPGFIKGSKHKDGLCAPCCFNKEWDSEFLAQRRKECIKDVSKKGKPASKKTKDKSNSEYIWSFETYPIEQYRYGFLPISVQLFFQSDNSKSVQKDNPTHIMKNTQTLLRYGVEQSPEKSFIGCISDLYSTSKDLEQNLSIEEMCAYLADEAITLDIFVKAHNGSLYSTFKPVKYNMDDIVIDKKYEETDFFATLALDGLSEEKQEFLFDTIAAYENFKKFLIDPKSIIDHTYLWDIVSMPNNKLFQTGLNLAILNIPEMDVRDNIEVICPTSAYSTIHYLASKPTFILLKREEYYEPIYIYDNRQDIPAIKKKLFNQEKQIDNINHVLKVIRNTSQKYCTPVASLPREYKFTQNINASTLKLEIIRQKYIILKQIINYQRKTIGLFIEYTERVESVDGVEGVEGVEDVEGVRGTGEKIYLPCFPSPLLDEIPYIFMDDPTLYTKYEETRDILYKIAKESDGRILCKPYLRLLEDGIIIGIVTETNQLILISEPLENTIMDDLTPISGENSILAEKALQENKGEDYKRKHTTKMISLEGQFYAVFRFIVKILLNQYQKKVTKENVREIIENPTYTYKYRLKKMQELLHKLCDSYVKFIEYEMDVLMSLDEIGDCFQDSSKEINNKYCFIENGDRKILLPKYNLFSLNDNKTIYFGRMADELIRYKRIQSFILDPKSYLNITNTQYKLNPNEMIILDSLLTGEYLSGLKPFTHSNIAKITYDNAQPIKTQRYSNEIGLDEQIDKSTKNRTESRLDIECVREKVGMKGSHSGYWRNVLPKSSTEIFLNSSRKCTYYFIIYIFKQINIGNTKINNANIDVELIKVTLNDGYAKYMEKYSEKILKILRSQGKKELIESVAPGGRISLEDLIFSESYFLTNLDLWILAEEMRLPIILFTGTKLKHLIDSTQWLKLYGDRNSEFYFIRAPNEPDKPGDYILDYSMIEKPVKLNNLGEDFKHTYEDGLRNRISLEQFLSSK